MVEQLRIWTGLTGFVLALAGVVLILFFALALPFGAGTRYQWFWLGPVNDWLSVLGAGPWIVATILLAGRARMTGWWWLLTGAVIAGILAMTVVTLLMLAGRATLNMQYTAAVPTVVLAFVWTAIAVGRAADLIAVPRWVVVVAVVVVGAFALALVLVAAASVVPAGPVRTGLWIACAIPGLLAWVGYPAIWLCVASTAR